jgi:hypothetical protein
VIPADRKWAMRTFVADIVTTTLAGLELSYPRVSDQQRQELADAKAALAKDG